MPPNKITALAIAGMMTAALAAGAIAQDTTLTVDPAIAGMTPDQMVSARQAAMKEDGKLMKGAASLTGADAVAAADTLIRNFSNLTALFPEGSDVAGSEALPSIWENFKEFNGIFVKNVAAATAMRAAAEAGDAAAYAGALKTIGASCGACHQSYRS